MWLLFAYQQKIEPFQILADSENSQDVRVIQLHLDRKLSPEQINFAASWVFFQNLERKFPAGVEVRDKVDFSRSPVAQ